MPNATTSQMISAATTDGDRIDVPARWIGRALAVHPSIKTVRAGKTPRGVWMISGHVHGLAAGVFRGKLADAIRLARVWDDAFADALPADRVTAPNLSQWEHAQQWGRQLRGQEPPTGPGAAYVARERITAADGDGGEQWPATCTITPVPGKPGRIRYARRLPDGRERLRNPETGAAVRMVGDVAAFKGPDPLTPVFRLWFRNQWVDVPTVAELMAWSFYGVCETPDGSRVEPDAPDAWLKLLGIV
ncbi:MAG: hypothetical protein ACO3IC_10110 [Burkholderiaceae bacterium]